MAYEDTNKSYIETLINNGKWKEAYAALRAYIEKYGEDYWAHNYLLLVKNKL